MTGLVAIVKILTSPVFKKTQFNLGLPEHLRPWHPYFKSYEQTHLANSLYKKFQSLALSESLINIGDAPPSCQHHRWPCVKTPNPGLSPPVLPHHLTPGWLLSVAQIISFQMETLASGVVLPRTLRGPEQRWRSSAGLSQVSGGREALTGPPLPSTAP